jgi:CHAD domain-containing protein
MREHARLQTAILLRRFAYEVSRSAQLGDPEAVHDLRVAIRRLSRCLRVFAQFYPQGAAKKTRRELAGLRDLAGAARDRHIALELLAAAGVSRRAEIVQRLEVESRKAERDLLQEIRRWRARGFSRKWRIRLGLNRVGKV